MKTLIKTLFLLALCSLVANCSSSDKHEDGEEMAQQEEAAAADNTAAEVAAVGDDNGSVEYDANGEPMENAGNLQPAEEPAPVADNSYADDSYSAPRDEASHAAPAADIPFKSGFYTFSQGCQMHADPSDGAQTYGTVFTDKKLWVDGHDSNWVIVHRKAGPAYVKSTCL